MYNHGQKERFIKESLNSISARDTAEWMFNHFEPFENEWRADLCTQSADTVKPVLEYVVGAREMTTKTRLHIFKAYIQWCADNSISGTNIRLIDLSVDDVGIDNMKKHYVRNPRHLQRILDVICAPESAETVDNNLRSFVWLVYSGIKPEDTISVKRDDINFESMNVTVGMWSYPLYRESLPAIRYCATNNSFRYIHPLYPDKIIYKERTRGEGLLRATRVEQSVGSLGRELSDRISKANDRGEIDFNLSPKKIWYSGIFYRAYEDELSGIDPDFVAVVDHYSGDKEYKLSSGRTTQAGKRRDIAFAIAKDYERWKAALRKQ